MNLPRLSLVTPLAALALLISPGPALGAVSHPFLQAINGNYEDACGVALQGGGLYVSDYYHDAIVTPTGKIPSVGSGSGPCKLAFDSDGNLYVNNWHSNVVKYAPPFETQTLIDSDTATGLAVDPATNNTYVTHRTYVAEYGPTGNLITDEIGLGSLREGFGVAVSDYPATAGYLYIADAAFGTVKVFDPETEMENPVDEWSGAANPQGGFKYLVDSELTVDNSPTSPSYGHVFVLDSIGHGLSSHPEGAFNEFTSAGYYRGQIAGFIDAEPSGIFIDELPGATNGNIYVTSGNSEGSQIFQYGPTAPSRALRVVSSGSGSGEVVSHPTGVSCGEACNAEFDDGVLLTLFATPDAHSTFTGWTVVGGPECQGLGSCSVLMNANIEVTATFVEPTQQTLTVDETGSGTGVVISSPTGLSCPTHCTEHFNEGRVVTLRAAPDTHSQFVGWTGCVVQANPAECKATMSEGHTVEAEFEPIPQITLSVVKGGSGQGTVTSFPGGISCPGGACSAAFDEDSTVYLLAAPAPTSTFGGFSGGDCTGTTTICLVQMSRARSIGVQFDAGAPGVPAGAASAGHLALGRLSVVRQTATLQVSVSGPGVILGAGVGLQPLRKSVTGGDVQLRLKLSRPARRAFHVRGLQHRRVKIAIAFVPADGSLPLRATRMVDFTTGPPYGAGATKRSALHRRR
jgi:hypothetical protein